MGGKRKASAIKRDPENPWAVHQGGAGDGKSRAGTRNGKAKEEGRTRARGAQSWRGPGAREGRR